MTRTPAHRFLAAFAGSPLDTRPDAELLDRFARYGERPALEAVVRRHAALVRGVCRRHLGPTADADDAFQATFLVLLRHVGRGRPPARVGPWLYSVAVKTAARLRSRRRFQPLTDAVPDRTPAPDPAADWVPLLDQELAGLPAKYRDALVLCELQGRSRREAATTLGLAEGTLSSRLSRGRELLRRRLLKHGTLLPAAGLGLVAEVASAETITAAVALADGAVPAAVAAAVPPAGWGLWKLVAAGVAACVVGGLAAVPGDDPPKAGEPAKPAAVAKAEPAKTAGPEVPDQEALQGVWLVEDVLLSAAGRQRLLPEMNGNAALLDGHLAAARGQVRMVVAGDHCWKIDADAIPYRLTLRPDRLPKWLDLTSLPDREAPAGGVVRAVYTSSGDRLTVAWGGRHRPTDTGPSDDLDVVKTEVHRKAPPPDPATAAALRPLLGRWQLVRTRNHYNNNGTVSEATLGWLEVTPHALFWRVGRPNVLAADFNHPNEFGAVAATVVCDPTKNPPWIDLDVLTALTDGWPAKRYGVYEQTGDTLRLVYGRNKTFRPLDFAVGPYKPKRLPDEDGGAHALPDGPDPRVESFEFKRADP